MGNAMANLPGARFGSAGLDALERAGHRVQGLLDDAVDRLVAWCRSGPELARVDRVEVVAEPPIGDGTFRVTG